MPSFKHTLVDLGPICDADCTVLFSKRGVTVYSPDGKPILTGWRDPCGTNRLWRFALQPHPQQLPPQHADAQETSLSAYSTYDLPRVQALVRYLHAAAGFPVKSTWIKAIKAGNFDTWPGLTCANATKYYPLSNESIKGHMVQSYQGVRSTQPKRHKTPAPPCDVPLPPVKTGEIHIRV